MLFDVRNTSVKVPDLNSQKRAAALVLASASFCSFDFLPFLPASNACVVHARLCASKREARDGRGITF